MGIPQQGLEQSSATRPRESQSREQGTQGGAGVQASTPAGTNNEPGLNSSTRKVLRNAAKGRGSNQGPEE